MNRFLGARGKGIGSGRREPGLARIVDQAYLSPGGEMHPANKLLRMIGLNVHRTRVPKRIAENRKAFEGASRASSRHFEFFDEPHPGDDSEHPTSYQNYECAFAAEILSRVRPESLLDVGSYQLFVSGLTAHFPVTSLDVRPRKPINPRETILVGDARAIPRKSASFDAAIALCAIEHFGLGRYGDEIDPEGDVKGMREMARVLKPGGTLIFSTNLTSGSPAIAFDAHRIYRYSQIESLCMGLRKLEEKFFSMRLGSWCERSAVTAEPRAWDVYLGAWQKPLDR